MNAANGMGCSTAGRSGTCNGSFGTVTGGLENSALGNRSVVVGGWSNRAFDAATVSGGYSNNAAGDGSTVVGGAFNEVRLPGPRLDKPHIGPPPRIEGMSPQDFQRAGGSSGDRLPFTCLKVKCPILGPTRNDR